MTLIIPPVKPKVIHLTDQMSEIINRTLAVTASGGLCVWCGRSRIGKTTTALYLKDEVERRLASDDLNAFRVGYYAAGPISKKASNPDRLGIVGLYEGVFGLAVDRGVALKSSEYLTDMAIDALINRKIRLIAVDEAGKLPPEAIRGMTQVWDKAQSLEWPLTILFIGMDELPKNIRRYPQVRNRVVEWCYFKEYTFEETWDLLRKFHPYFAALDPLKPGHRAMVEFIFETYGGVPGLILPFVHTFDRRIQGYSKTVDVKFLRVIHLATAEEERMIRESQRREYLQRPDRQKSGEQKSDEEKVA
jgi:hypothetical protein